MKKKQGKKKKKKPAIKQRWRKIPHASKCRGFKKLAAPKDDLSLHAAGTGRMYKAFDLMNKESKRLRRLDAQSKIKSSLAAVVYKNIDKTDSDSPARFSFQYKLMTRAIKSKVFGPRDFIVPFVHLNPDNCIAFGAVIKFEGVIFCGQVYGPESLFESVKVTRKLVTKASLLGSKHFAGHDFKLCAEVLQILFSNCMTAAIDTVRFKSMKTFTQALLLRTDTLDATGIVRGLFEQDYSQGGTDIVNHLVLTDKFQLMKMLIAVHMDHMEHEDVLPVKFYPRDFVKAEQPLTIEAEQPLTIAS